MAVCPNCHETNPEAGGACPRCDGYHYIPDEALEDAERDPIIGTMASGKYVVLSLISEGGMGAVYRALQMPVEREVAFKVLRTELKDSDQGRDRFVREARAVSKLNHPNIITLYDFGFDQDKHPYMVMEYAPGDSLDRWLKKERTLDQILHVTQQVVSALCEAHKRGIVHRDLKPENMIVSPTGNDQDFIKLLDFGIARLINEGATRGLTRDGEVFGTPHYMAPEQAQGAKNVGPPADIYAVGIMMYEMLTGECPFDAPTPLSVLFMHINDELPPMNGRPGIEVDPGLEQIVRRACAKEPIDRYQTASEMLTAIQQYAHDNGVMVTGRMQAVHRTGEVVQLSQRSTEAMPSAQGPAQLANRSSHVTASGVSSDVRVYDPDPSLEQPWPPEKKAPVKLIAAAVVALLLVAGLGGVLFAVLLNDDGEAVANEVNGVEPAEQPSTEDGAAEMAANDDVEPLEEPSLPDDSETAKPDEDRLAEQAEKKEQGTAVAPIPVEKTTRDEAEPEPKAEEKEPVAKKTTRKKVEKRVEKRQEPEKVEEEDEPKRFQPRKFGSPAPKKKKFEKKFAPR